MTAFDRRAVLTRLASLAGLTASGALPLLASPAARAQATPGVSASEISFGSTTSYSGPVSALGTIHRTQLAYFKMLNEQGGIAGRKLNYVVYDDGFSPPKTVEMTRKLLERDEVAFLFSPLGTGPNTAIVRMVNDQQVPHLFLTATGDKWGDHKNFPWTMGFAPSGRIETRIFVKHALQQNPKARIAILYQNDDHGRDYLNGARDVLGDRFDSVVKTASYEVADPTIDSQVIQLQATGADVLISGVAGKFGAMVVRKVHDIGWKPMHFIANGVASINATFVPAGVERAVGIIASAYGKDTTDPAWADDAGVKAYKAFMAKWYPEGNPAEQYNAYGFMLAGLMHRVLEQCKGNFTRQNIMAQANNLKDVELPLLLPGVRVNTSATEHHPLRQLQLQRFDGKAWQRFGNIIST